MDMHLEEIVSKKPHLKDLIKFYEKFTVFAGEVRSLLLPEPDILLFDRKAYPASAIEPLFRHFSTLMELPQDMLEPLKRAMEVGDIDLTRLPLREVPAFSLPYAEDDLTMLLFLLGRPYFSRMREACGHDVRSWAAGRCPVCNGQPSLLSNHADGERKIHCSYCGTAGTFSADGCPVCLTGDAGKISRHGFDGEEMFEVAACDNCRSYVKIADMAKLRDMDPDLADLLSLPLDFVMQGKGYVRRAPNPLGMVKMSLAG